MRDHTGMRRRPLRAEDRVAMVTMSVFASVISGSLFCNGGYLAFDAQKLLERLRPVEGIQCEKAAGLHLRA